MRDKVSCFKTALLIVLLKHAFCISIYVEKGQVIDGSRSNLLQMIITYFLLFSSFTLDT